MLPAEQKGLSGWWPIFRAGRQTDSRGRCRTYTEGDLDQIIERHGADNPAPLVFGHEEKPLEPLSPYAYGWTAALKRIGKTLYARAKQVQPEFEALVRSGALRNRSVQLLDDDKGLRLGHIAFLGAASPAVEGLAPVEFSADSEHTHDYAPPAEFMSAGDQQLVVRIMRRLREWIIGRVDKDTADGVINPYELEELERHALDAQRTDAPADHAAPDGGNDEMSDNERDKLRAEFEAREKALQEQLAAERASRRLDQSRAWVSEQVDAGRLLPAQTAGLAEFMASLPDGEDAAPLEFSRAGGEGKTAEKVRQSPAQFMRGWVEGLAKNPLMGGPVAGEDTAPDAPPADVDEIRARASEYIAAQEAKGIATSNDQAVRHVMAGGEL